VKDDAHLAFNGVGKIKKASKASDNQQETRLLNLSRTAEAIANPFLLIDEGDITAGHAASIGQLDEEQIYYLMSRGMSKAEASKMIVSGFLAPFIDVIRDEGMKEALMTEIEKKLG
jgi:Fe-S cluster assembly protein SufD